MNKKTSDNQLVELAKSNPDVFEELVNRYWRRLFGYVRRISYFSNEDIEDILQDVFIKTYKNLNSFDNKLKFSSWIYRITRNCTIDAIRKKQSRPAISQMDMSEAVNLFKSSTDLEGEVSKKDDLERIEKIIKSLPLKYREVMILKFSEEKTYDEIIDILKKPKGTVASLINRGRKQLIKKAKEQNIVIE
jgi:RNA polymerase sigma-70 factor, ECF subfamily